MIKNQENAVTGCGMNNVTRGIRTSFLGSVGPNFLSDQMSDKMEPAPGTRDWNHDSEGSADQMFCLSWTETSSVTAISGPPSVWVLRRQPH